MKVLHSSYLPFTEEQLATHFAPIHGDDRADPERHLAHYRDSIARFEAPPSSKTPADVRRRRQIEKDERFWVAAALMALYHGRSRRAAFADLLTRAGAETPAAYADWSTALHGDLHLFFEAGLPSPLSYRECLKDSLDERSPIPYVRESAERAKLRLEGRTYVDALLVAPATGVGVLFEGKVLSDCSSTVTYDVFRNQLARNVDCMLERQDGLPAPLGARDPDQSCFVLLSPEIFRKRPHTRLYGWLLNEYRADPSALKRDLPHRTADWSAVSHRIGWATFEDCQRVVPTACPWLPDVKG